MSIKKILQKGFLPLSMIVLIIVAGSFFYFFKVVKQNQISAETLRVERTIDVLSYCHIYFLTAVKEKRGYQLQKEKKYFNYYTLAKNNVALQLTSLQKTFFKHKEEALFNRYQQSITQRLSKMDEYFTTANILDTNKTLLNKTNKNVDFDMQSNEEEVLYGEIIKRLEKKSLALEANKKNIEKYNYVGFIILIVLTVLLVFLNMNQVKRITYQSLRRQKDKELLAITKASEQEFSSAFEYASIGMALIGLKGEWLRVNKSLCNLLGYSITELMLCTFQDITHEDDLESDLGYLEKLIKDEIKTYKMPKRYYTKSGEIIWINLSVSKVLNTDGSIKHFISQIENINDVKLSELALKNEKERLANVLDGTNAGTWELDMQTGETVYNERWAAIAGYTLEELKPINLNTWRELVHLEDLKKSDEKLLACFENNETYYDCECRLKHKDGHYVWVLDRGKVISRTEDGKPLLMSGTQTDISAIKNAEQTVREKQALLETILNSIDVGIVACNVAGELTIFNKAIKDMHGLPLEAIREDKWAQHYDLYDAEGSAVLTTEQIPLCQALNNGQVTTKQISIIPRDRQRLVLKTSGSQIKDENGTVYGAVVALHDITEQNKIEKLLAFNEKRFRGIFNATHQLMGFLDVDGNIIETNDTSLKFAGAKAEDVIGKKFWDGPWWYHSKTEQVRLQVAFSEAKTGRLVQYETTHINAEGKQITILFNLKPLFDDDENVIAIISEGRPIQDIADARKRLNEKNEELQQFAALASHDLKEPLRMIKSFMQLLKKNYAVKLDDKANKYIDFAVDGAERMNSFIKDLLAYSNTGSEEIPREQVNTQTLVDDIAGMQKAVLLEKSAVLKYENLPTIIAHKTPLTLVLQNLINNALKYQPVNANPIITITAEDKKDYWQFAVKDNGIGIEEQYLIKIFDLFKRLHVNGEYSGTGMGLATCKKIVQQHGGNIWVTSKPGQGSTFYFTFSKLTS